MTRTRWLITLLFASLSFNAAAGVAYLVARQPKATTSCSAAAQGIPGASAEQAMRVGQIRAQFTQATEPLRRELEDRSAELAHLAVNGGPSDAARLAALGSEVSELHDRLQALAVESLQREGQALGPAQREAYCATLQTRLCPRASGGSCGAGRP